MKCSPFPPTLCHFFSSSSSSTVTPNMSSSSSSSEFDQRMKSTLDTIAQSGLYKHERILSSPQNSHVSVQSHFNSTNNESRENIKTLNFCSNNYLGLANHPKLISAAKRALDTHGFGVASVRFICGTQDLHKELEEKVSEFYGTDDTILYSSCFDANAGLFEVLLTENDAVFSDELNHASIIDGIRLCKASRYRYSHMDMNHLETQLKESLTKSISTRMIVTDGVFSMDGDYAPLEDITFLANKYHALLFVDDCHCTGFVGKTGRGSGERAQVMDKVDIVNSTFGKALGGASGGYTTARKDIVELLRQKSRPYLFSNALAPSLTAATIEVFDMVSKSTQLRDKLFDNTRYFREKMSENGFILGVATPFDEDQLSRKVISDHPIVPIMIGDAQVAQNVAQDMWNRGVYVVAFSYPVVPKHKARIRVQISAAHSKPEIDFVVNAFTQVAHTHNLFKT